MVVVTAGIRPNVGLGVVSGLTVERAIVVDDQMRRVDDAGHLRRRRVRPAPRAGVRAGRAAVGAGDGARRPPHRRRPGRGVPRLAQRDEAQGRGRRRRVDGGQAPGARGRRVRAVLRAAARRLQVGGRARRQAGRRHAARRHRARSRSSRRASTAACRCRRSAWSCCSTWPAPARGGGRRGDGRLAPGLQLQRRVQGRRSRRASAAGETQRVRGDGGDAGRQGLRVLQGAGRRRSSSGPPSGRGRGRSRRAAWYVPAIPLGKPALIEAIRERGLRSVSAVFAALGPDGEDARRRCALASLLKTVWAAEYVDERTPGSSTTGCTPTSSATARSPSCRGSSGGVTTADELRRIADVADRFDDPDDQGDRRAADRPARRAQGGPAGGVGGPRTCPRATRTASRCAR